MCGISAIINPDSEGSTVISLMLGSIEYRGDTIPMYDVSSSVILGSVRLKIVDELQGNQPFFNTDRTIGVVFNGEIYNYDALKKRLEKLGYKFVSNCDTEVLIYLYEEYGTKFILELDGMFSFLIYDYRSNFFIGVRDYFGIKPFYYCKDKSTVYVSSEMKSFFHLNVKKFEELSPGHFITNEGIFCYYKIQSNVQQIVSIDNISQNIRDLLDEAVKKRVQTSLPIAVFLSGGLDSSIIYMLCCKYHEDVTALIIGNETADDVIYAKRLCNDLQTKFEHISIDGIISEQSIFEAIYCTESFEPNTIRGSVLSLRLSECAHNLGFKVVLCGEGSDEIFGGYGDFLYIENEEDFQKKSYHLFGDLFRSQLLRIDRTGMKHSVEVREPFLDKSLVEYVMGIPSKLKVAKNDKSIITTKYILRESFKADLPSYILFREKMTLMQGAGIGSVERHNSLFSSFASKHINNEEYQFLKHKFSKYSLVNKEEAYYFKIFSQFFLRAKFATTRIQTAQTEIIF